MQACFHREIFQTTLGSSSFDSRDSLCGGKVDYVESDGRVGRCELENEVEGVEFPCCWAGVQEGRVGRCVGAGGRVEVGMLV